MRWLIREKYSYDPSGVPFLLEDNPHGEQALPGASIQAQPQGL